MNLLIRSYPTRGESLSSYLQRISKLNYISAHDLWRYIMRKESHYPQSSFSASLDICPNSFIDLDLLASMLKINKDDLEYLTFIPTFKKLGVSNVRINHSRVLSNTIEEHRKFCPKCIEENRVYKLIWQVKEVQYCPIHNIKLHYKCNNCDIKIAIVPSTSEIGICTSCKSDLKESVGEAYIPTSIDLRIIEDWAFLLDPMISVSTSINTLPNEQSLSLRLLHLLHEHENDLNKKEQTTLSSLMQIARSTKVKQTFVHIDTVLHFTRKFNISLSNFFTLEIPDKFIDLILRPQKRIVDDFSCLAPWCNHYQKPGSLEKTSTTVKSLKSGQELKYYMFCNDCGTEYGISRNDNKLVERGYFIDLAWYQVKDRLSTENRFTELSRILNLTEDKLRRAIIFLAANQLIDHNNVPIKIPSLIETKIITLIKGFIKQGFTAKQIQIMLHMKYNDFLFYWLTAEIRKSYFKNIIKRPNKHSSQLERGYKLESAINDLLTENKPITIKEICKNLNISPETLRNWGFLHKVKEYKAIQKTSIDNDSKLNITQKVDKLSSELLSTGTQISSESFYEILGISRNVLVRKSPDLTKYIYSKLIAINES